MRGNKYHAKPTICQRGHKHASKREAMRCTDLHLLQMGGVISDLVVEPQFWFVINGDQVKHGNGRRVGYKPDFGYVENGRDIVEDVKGFAARDFELRASLFRHLFPTIELRVVK